MIIKYQIDTLNFAPSCSLELLKHEAITMRNYVCYLEMRAEIKSIEL